MLRPSTTLFFIFTEGNSAAVGCKPQFVLEMTAAKPPEAGKPPKPDKTPNTESPPQTSPSPPIASDYPIVNSSFIALNIIGSLFLTLGVGLGVLVLLSINRRVSCCFHFL